MHVGFVGARAPLSPERTGAIEKLTVELAVELASRGVEVTAFTTGENAPREYTAEGVRFVEIAKPITKPPSHVAPVCHFGEALTDAVREHHRESPIDVLHASYYPNLLGFSAPANVPVVATEHNAHPWQKEHQHIDHLSLSHRLRWEADTYIRRFEARLAFRKVERIFSVSDEHGRWIADVLPRFASRIETMYNFVDTDTYRPDAAEGRDDVTLPEGPTLLYVGRTVPHKGLHRAVEALDEMERDATLAVVGPLGPGFDGSGDASEMNPDDVDGYLGDVLETIADRNLNEQIRFVGFVDEDALPAYYAVADAVAFPSVFESFGMIPIEAAACGTPTVAHDVAPMTETIQDGEAGRLVSVSVSALASGLDEVLDSETNERLGSNARRVAVAEFSRSARADDHLQVYEDLTDATPYQKD